MGVDLENLHSRPEAVQEAIDDLLDQIGDPFFRDRIRDARSRKDYSWVAAHIAEDRHGAGSTAAICVAIILLRHGVEMATDFARDLKYHES